ncbi:MAG: hypothetical protein K9I47_12115 [Bacteroidales bacterium]|nr:hypothetical protein [Bacteroidales bacterium]
MAKIPLGLQVIKWMEFYYPIFSSSEFIAQQANPNRMLAFRNLYKDVIDYYQQKIGPGFEIILESFKKSNIPKEIYSKLFNLIKKLAETIQKQPMTYIGSSFGQKGKIFIYNNDSSFNELKKNISLFNIINYTGSYSIPMQYYDVFRVMGKYLIGMDSLLSKWAEYTSNINQQLDKDSLYSIFYNQLNYSRDTNKMNRLRAVLENEKDMFCAWTGRKLRNEYHIDHVLPFSFFRNDDFWNLLPSKPENNRDKRALVPSPELLRERKDLIYNYWDLYHKHFQELFQEELEVSLLGEKMAIDDWKKKGLESLIGKSNFLITELGYEPYNAKN